MNKHLLSGAALGGLFLLSGVDLANGQSKTNTGEDNPTAYTALRLISKNLGRDALERVVQVTGHDGVPQPFLWKVVLREGAGSREIEVAGGKISAQRPLTRPPESITAIRLADLNLDSSGAFDATDVQARKVNLRYDSLNYALQVSPSTGKPVWHIDLLDKEGSPVGVIQLAAHDGTILSTDGRLANNPVTGAVGKRPVASRLETPRTVESLAEPTRIHSTVAATTVHTNPPPEVHTATTQQIPVATLSDTPEDGAASASKSSEEGGLFTRTGRTLDKTSHTVEHHLRRAGATVQKFFTGHSDIDQDDKQE